VEEIHFVWHAVARLGKGSKGGAPDDCATVGSGVKEAGILLNATDGFLRNPFCRPTNLTCTEDQNLLLRSLQ